MTVVVRPATAADLDGVVATFLACWYDSYEQFLPPDTRELYTVDSATELWRRAPTADLIVAEVAGAAGLTGVTDVTGLVDVTGVGLRGVLGVARFGADRTDSQRGHVFSLYVHPDSQGLGVGRALLDGAVDRLRQAGYGEATLWVFADNTAARAFYTRQGWTPDGATRTEPAYRLPEIRLTRALT